MNWPTELSPDEPRDEPARLINPALWAYWLFIGQTADLTEAEIVQSLDTCETLTQSLTNYPQSKCGASTSS